MSRFKDKFASGAGSVLEWYDFSIYGFFAPLIAQLYFPSESLSMSLLKTFVVFAVGFVARPAGALIFGYISDKYGRARCLKITPVLITIPTALFAILPTYDQIGVLAPSALVVLRICQGICIGGEFTNNIIYLCETTKPGRRYFLGSIGSCTGSLGILLASSVAAFWYLIFSPQNLLLWGWRIAFAISILLGMVAYWLRKNMAETPTYLGLVKDRAVAQNPIIDSYKNQWQDYLVAFGLTYLSATAFYFVFMFLPNYMSSFLDIKASRVLGDNSLSLLIRLFIIPIFGLIAGRLGGISMTRIAALLFIFFSLPLFYIIIYLPHAIVYAIYAFALLTTINAATTPGLLVGLLNPRTRCTILSFTFNACFGIFGGLSPVIGFLLVNKFQSKITPVYYLIFAAFVTLITTFFKKSSQTHDK